MKHPITAYFLLASCGLVVAGCAIPGCTATGGLLGTGLFATSQPSTQPALSPQQQNAQTLAQISTGYTLILRALIAAEDVNIITHAQFELTLPYRNATSEAIYAADQAIVANASTADTLLIAAQTAYHALQSHPVVSLSTGQTVAAPTTKGS
jgi:hypothetical protein